MQLLPKDILSVCLHSKSIFFPHSLSHTKNPLSSKMEPPPLLPFCSNNDEDDGEKGARVNNPSFSFFSAEVGEEGTSLG